MEKVELLAPAGGMDNLIAAIDAGADAIYIGGTSFGARKQANNPELEELLWGIDYVHLFGKKIYLTVNTLIKEKERREVIDFLRPYYERGIDGVIVQDIGILKEISCYYPDLPLHASTQMSIVDSPGVRLLEELGVERVVPARELSLQEIREIRKRSNIELECFIHGAMCYSYSGQCLFSSILGGRSGNRGLCAQPCRLPFSVNGGKQQDIMSLKDLNTLALLPELIEAGISSFKIEGRMKSPQYVSSVVSIYRKYIDRYYCGKDDFQVEREDAEKLNLAFQRRGYTTGYYKTYNGKNMLSLSAPVRKEERLIEINKKKLSIEGSIFLKKSEPLALVLRYGEYEVKVHGEVVQEAKNMPLSKEKIKEQISKTGNSDFNFGRLDVEIEGDVFIPIKALNTLRREGLELLREKILSVFRRKSVFREEALQDEKEKIQKKERLSASILNLEQLKSCMEETCFDRIYVDSELIFQNELKDILKENEHQEIYLMLPSIFRKSTRDLLNKEYGFIEETFDGILVENFEEIQWLKEHEYQKDIVGDNRLYVMNKSSKKTLYDLGLKDLTVPFELNNKELKQLGISDMDFIIYGRIPLMVTANCIEKNTKECRKTETVNTLRDRYQKKFPVKNFCKYCYNVVYNSAPLVLWQEERELEKLSLKSRRFLFTIESKEDIRQLMSLYHRREKPEFDYTKGHFKRGVE